MDSINLIGIGIGLILAGIGAVYAYSCVMLWRHTNITGVGVEVTKDRSFLSNNFKLVIIIGALSSLHILFELVQNLNLIWTSLTLSIFNVLYYLDLSGVMLALLLLAIAWYKLLSKVNAWDTRWIKPDK
jgi:hypothetical protein